MASDAEAQVWSDARTRPLLRQIVSVDATGEASWPYGREDIAGDGLSSFEADEAGTDVRTVYAHADAERLWLRAYVAAGAAPEDVVAFFFADTDDRDDTGGPAFGPTLWSTWTSDPTPGGYERALGLRSDGTVLGAWSFSAQSGSWTALSLNDGDVRVEVGADEDPIDIGARVRGYVQTDFVHGLSGFTASCAGNLFVRVWHDAPAPRSFGDDDAEPFSCVAPVDAYGDPVVLRSVDCRTDADCPNDGTCSDGVCLFAYACSGAADCQPDETCTANACVRVVSSSCTNSTECNGLVCSNGACVACSDSGASACAQGLTCSPNGTCADPSTYVPGGTGAGGNTTTQGEVRGGAFHCATAFGHTTWAHSSWLWALACAGLLRRRRVRRERVAPCKRRTP